MTRQPSPLPPLKSIRASTATCYRNYVRLITHLNPIICEIFVMWIKYPARRTKIMYDRSPDYLRNLWFVCQYVIEIESDASNFVFLDTGAAGEK
jgi:hypothetical protein